MLYLSEFNDIYESTVAESKSLQANNFVDSKDRTRYSQILNVVQI